MNRRGIRVVEFYGYALIAGIGHDEARYTLPGYILDMYMMRLKYDCKLAGMQLAKKSLGM